MNAQRHIKTNGHLSFNRVLLRSLVLLSILIVPSAKVSPETWFMQGNWEYYALCDSSYHPDFKTESNTIEVYRDLGDGHVIIRSVAHMIDSRRGAILPVSPPPGMEDTIQLFYSDDTEKSKTLADLAHSIIGSVATEEGAVDQLSVWVRDHVTYSLGVSTDPLDVVKNGRAYCEGYASLMVALMREVGIPARTADCYIAPGNGWGFADDGGNHAFVVYYYPGIGWLCLDPQTTSGYVDPFHLVNFTGQIYAQYRQAPDAYVTDYSEEPNGWDTYSSAGKSGTRRGFAIRLRGAAGPIFHPYLAISQKELAPSKDYFSTNMLGKPWMSEGDDQGITITTDATHVKVTPGNGNGWVTYFAMPGVWPESGEDILAVEAAGFLGLMKLTLDPNSFVTADFDYSGGQAMQAMRICVRDPGTGKLASGQTVDLSMEGVTEKIETNSSGCIFISCIDSTGAPLKGLDGSLKMGDQEYPFTFQAGSSIAIPDQSNREAALQAALASSRAQATAPQLRLVTRDSSGTSDASIVRSASLFDGSVEKRLSSKGAGFLVADGLEIGKSYVLRLNIAGINVQRLIGPVEAGPGLDLEIRLDDLHPAIITRANPFDTSSFTLYEYFDDKDAPWPLTGDRGLVRWDCPSGSYLVADNASRANVMSLAIDPGKESAYAPSSMDLATFRFSKAFQWKTPSVVSGRIVDSQGPIRTGKILLVDRADLSMTTMDLDATGFFYSQALKPTTTYTLVYSDSDRLFLHSFITDLGGGANLDLSLSDNCISCCTYDNQNQNATDVIYLLFAATIDGDPKSQSIAIQVNEYFDLYADEATYLLSTQKTILGASVVAGGVINGQPQARDAIIHLGSNRDEPGFIERSQATLKTTWPGASGPTFACFSDSEAEGWKSAMVDVEIDNKALRPAFDSLGFFQLPPTKGSRFAFLYSRPGLYWEGSHTLANPGPDIIDLKPQASNRVRIDMKGSQSLSLLKPYMKSGQLELGEVTLNPDRDGMLVIEGQGGGVWLRAQNGAIRYCSFADGRIAFRDKTMPEQAKAWESLLHQYDPDGVHRIVDLRGLGTIVLPRFTDENGRNLPFWSPRNMNGLFILTGLACAYLDMNLQQNGLFLRQSWHVSTQHSIVLIPRPMKPPSFLLKLTGPAYKTQNVPVILHSGGALAAGTIKGDTGKFYLSTSPAGNLRCTVPEGVWWIEIGNQIRKVVVDGDDGQVVGMDLK